jgi:transcriptional regulator with XRE-family HTH domain
MTENIYDYIASKIKELRQKAGFSQEALAEKIKVAANTVSRWETATYKPAIEDLEKLAEFFDVPISAFLPSDGQERSSAATSLLSATQDLKKEDLVALEEFAEYLKLRKLLKLPKKDE